MASRMPAHHGLKRSLGGPGAIFLSCRIEVD